MHHHGENEDCVAWSSSLSSTTSPLLNYTLEVSHSIFQYLILPLHIGNTNPLRTEQITYQKVVIYIEI